MKKIFLFLISITIFSTAYSQRKKEFQIRGGFGWSVYSTTTELSANYNGFTFSNTHDDNAATVHLPLEFRYELSRRFNIGLDMKFGSYIYNPDSADGKSNRFAVIGTAGEYNFISKDDFRWYVGAGFTSASLELEESYDSFAGAIKNISKYNGPGFRINTGILWFFLGHLGLNANLGFDNHDFELKTFEQNGLGVDLSNINGKLTVKGVDGTLGLALRF